MFQGVSRIVHLSAAAATLGGLQAAVASTFGTELSARPGGALADSDLCFTRMDEDGDEVVFNTDSELSLALRLCPSTLEISAASKAQSKVRGDTFFCCDIIRKQGIFPLLHACVLWFCTVLRVY